MKTCFVVNPRSGRASRALPEVKRFADAHGARIVLTEAPGHACELARQALADGCGLVVAVGGDGTVNEVARALLGTPAILGLVPCGSGDGLGRHLRIHGSVARALHLLHHGRPRQIDTATADGHPYFTTAGVGFEAEMAHRFNRPGRRGFASYLRTSAAGLLGWEPREYVVTHGDRREVFRAFTLTVANAAQYGNGARIAPAARIDDGLLDLSAIPPVTFMNAVPLLCRLFSGTIAGAPGVALRRAKRFVLECNEPGLLHTDGETHEAGTTIEFVVRPGNLLVMCPA